MLGVVLAFELWWIYFDVVAIANVRRLVRAPVGREQNELARDVYSYLHFPLVAGIVLVAFGLHEALEHSVRSARDGAGVRRCSAASPLYLLGHVAVRLRGAHTLNVQRLVLAIVLLALIPAAAQSRRWSRSRGGGAARGDDRLRDAQLRIRPRPDPP